MPYFPGKRQIASGKRQTWVETSGAIVHHWTKKNMSSSKHCLLLAVETDKETPKNIGKLEYFGFTCNLSILRMFLRKKTLLSSLVLNDAVLHKINCSVYDRCFLF